jgi:hypothetical protein
MRRSKTRINNPFNPAYADYSIFDSGHPVLNFPQQKRKNEIDERLNRKTVND